MICQETKKWLLLSIIKPWTKVQVNYKDTLKVNKVGDPKAAFSIATTLRFYGGARGVMVIVAGCGHGDTSSNPRRDWLHFSHSTNTLGKGMNPNILPPAMGK